MPWNVFKRLKISQSYQEKNPIFQQDTCGLGWRCRKEVCVAVTLLKKTKSNQPTNPTNKQKPCKKNPKHQLNKNNSQNKTQKKKTNKKSKMVVSEEKICCFQTHSLPEKSSWQRLRLYKCIFSQTRALKKHCGI